MKSDSSKPERATRKKRKPRMETRSERTSPGCTGSQPLNIRDWWRGSRFSHVVWRLIREDIQAVEYSLPILVDPALAYGAKHGGAIHGGAIYCEQIQVETEIRDQHCSS